MHNKNIAYIAITSSLNWLLKWIVERQGRYSGLPTMHFFNLRPLKCSMSIWNWKTVHLHQWTKHKTIFKVFFVSILTNDWSQSFLNIQMMIFTVERVKNVIWSWEVARWFLGRPIWKILKDKRWLNKRSIPNVSIYKYKCVKQNNDTRVNYSFRRVDYWPIWLKKLTWINEWFMFLVEQYQQKKKKKKTQNKTKQNKTKKKKKKPSRTPRRKSGAFKGLFRVCKVCIAVFCLIRKEWIHFGNEAEKSLDLCRWFYLKPDHGELGKPLEIHWFITPSGCKVDCNSGKFPLSCIYSVSPCKFWSRRLPHYFLFSSQILKLTLKHDGFKNSPLVG